MFISRFALAIVFAGAAAPALADRVTCHSTKNGPEPCGTVQPGSSVHLARQLGDRPCIEGRTWGTGPDRDSIWVSGGCSAVFDVQPPSGGNDDSDNGGRYSSDRNAPGGAADTGARSSDWQRGYADGQRGNADPNATSQDYLEGFRAGEDAAGNRYGSTPPPRTPADNTGVFESVPNEPQAGRSDRDAGPNADDDRPDDYGEREAPPPDRYPPPNDSYPPPGYGEPPPGARYERRRGEHYASIDEARANARQACLDAAARGRRYGPDRIISRQVRWIGHGEFAVGLDTPEGELICTVDREGNVHSIDNR